MQVAVLGATGPLGLILTKLLLKDNFKVTVIARNISKIEDAGISSENLKLIEGDLFNEEFLCSNLNGIEIVFSALGAKISLWKINLMTDLIPIIVSASRKVKVRRIIICTANCTVYNPDHPVFLEWVFKPLLIGRNMDDFHRAEEFLQSRECDDVDFVVVKPPGLTNFPMSDKLVLAEEGQFVKVYTSRSIPRENVAQFMIKCIEDDNWRRKLVAISL